jgi:hypothetical protein
VLIAKVVRENHVCDKRLLRLARERRDHTMDMDQTNPWLSIGIYWPSVGHG